MATITLSRKRWGANGMLNSVSRPDRYRTRTTASGIQAKPAQSAKTDLRSLPGHSSFAWKRRTARSKPMSEILATSISIETSKPMRPYSSVELRNSGSSAIIPQLRPRASASAVPKETILYTALSACQSFRSRGPIMRELLIFREKRGLRPREGVFVKNCCVPLPFLPHLPREPLPFLIQFCCQYLPLRLFPCPNSCPRAPLPYIPPSNLEPRNILKATPEKYARHFTGQVCLHIASQVFFTIAVNLDRYALSYK